MSYEAGHVGREIFGSRRSGTEKNNSEGIRVSAARRDERLVEREGEGEELALLLAVAHWLSRMSSSGR